MIHDDHHLNHHDQCALLGKFCELDNILFFYLHFQLITVFDLDDDHNQVGMVRALFSLSHCPSQVASCQRLVVREVCANFLLVKHEGAKLLLRQLVLREECVHTSSVDE